MRLLLLNCAFFAASTLASSTNLAARQYAPLVDAFKKLNGKIVAFDTLVNTLTLNSSVEVSSSKFTTYSEDLVTTAKDAAILFSEAWVPQVWWEAVDIAPQIAKLNGNTETVIDSLISKKEAIINFGLVEATRKQLGAQRDAIDAFAKALSSKLPTAIKPGSDAIIKELGNTFNRGLAAFA